MSNSIETKVISAAAGSGVGAALSAFVLWILGVTVWHVPDSAAAAAQALAAVPSPVTLLVGAVFTVSGSFIAGYAAPHTMRPDGDLTEQPVKPDPFVSSTAIKADPATTKQDQADALALLSPPVGVDTSVAADKIAALRAQVDGPASTAIAGQDDDATTFTPLTPSAPEATS